jgi:hypothetical protein
MKKLLTSIVVVSMLSGCATTDYRVNNQNPNDTLKIIGTIVVVGALASAISPNKGQNACKSYMSVPGQSSPNVITTYKSGPC